jgi:hypothetical protein
MIQHRLGIAAARNATLAATVLVSTSQGAVPWKQVGEFEDASIRVEQNATDGDTEIVITAKPLTDLGLKQLSIISPHWRKVLEVDAPLRSRGLREFLFESPEPSDARILASYPEGDYLYFGVATNDTAFYGAAELAHQLPGATIILAPAADQQVSAGSLTIRWAAVADAAQYIVEVENESADPEQSFSVNLPASVTSFLVPEALIVPASDYQIGVATVHENGNVVFVEASFSTAE